LRSFTKLALVRRIILAPDLSDAATIKGVVDRLHFAWFRHGIERSKDRRRRAVSLTDRGRQVTEAAMFVAAEITAATSRR
jgi:hypothetical protein